MKKALIIFTVLLVLGGLLFGLYYFLWTPENFASLGSSAMNDKDYDDAIEYYSIASDLAPKNTEYVLRLADACIANGSYTQAERTIVEANRRAPSAELYRKLSEIYVAQDKLFDAQRMLDTVNDPAIAAELSASRPEVPVSTPEGGSFEDYTEITLSSGDCAIYYSLNEEYPSTQKNLYTEPIALSSGDTHISAIAVGADSLVSPLFEADYLVVGIVEPVDFASAELENYVRDTLYIARTEEVMTSDLWEITELTVPDQVRDFSDLRHFMNLTSLTILDSSIDDFSFLTYMPGLQALNLSGCLISADAVEYIGTLSELTELRLQSCGLSNIRAFSTLANITVLDLSNNSISDINALSGMTAMTELNLCSNAISNLSSLKNMRDLSLLDISSNQIASLAPLSSCLKLTELIADNNKLTGTADLSELTRLTTFTAANNSLTELNGLAGCTQIAKLAVSNNQLTTVEVLANMPVLTYLDISHNQITALPSIAPTSRLQQFYASYNALEDISTLAGLQELTYVDVDYNSELEDIVCLASCPLLVQVNAFGTKVTEVKALTDLSVIVNYDPTTED